ncbi:MAG: radical SAM protein [archaeon]
MDPRSVPKELFKYNNWRYVDKIDRLYRWMNGETAPPYKIIIVPTNRCNLNCFCCPNSFARTQGRFRAEDELTKDEWMEVIDTGLGVGVKEWYFLGGGEPMLHKGTVIDAVTRIKRDHEENICEIISNGTLFEKGMIQDLVKLKLNRLLLSIDGHNSEIHDYVRRKDGAFKRARETLRLFAKYKKKLKSDKPVLQMNCVISSRNYDKIAEITEFAIENDVNELALHPMREYEETRHQVQHLKLNREQEKAMFEGIAKARKIAGKSQMSFNNSMVEESYGGCEEDEEETEIISMDDEQIERKYLSARCYEPFYSMFIDPKGNANFCCAAGDGRDENNIRQGLEKVWYGAFFNRIREKVRRNEATEKCHNCGLLDMTRELREDLRKYVYYLKNG